jgi:hypothetical protein
MQKVAALRLLEASRLSFDRPLPGKPPNIPDRLSHLVGAQFLLLRYNLSVVTGLSKNRSEVRRAGRDVVEDKRKARRG